MLLNLSSALAGDEVPPGVFHGHWLGKAQYTTPFDQNLICPEIRQIIQQTADRLVLVAGSMQCPPYKVTFKTFSLQIKNEDLLSGPYKVGTLQGGRIQLDYRNEKGFHVQVDSEVVNGIYKYWEREFNPQGRLAWSIQGIMSKE